MERVNWSCSVSSFFEYPERFQNIELVGLNDPHEREVLLHLLKYDSVHGKFPFSLSLVDQGYCRSASGSIIPDSRYF